MRSLFSDRRNRRLSWAVGVSLSFAAGSVLADAPKSEAIKPAPGIMTFANVKVVNVAPDAATGKQAVQTQSQQQGVRAYLDGSGRLREQTGEERIAIANEKAKAPVKSLNRSGARTALSSEAAATEPQEFYGVGGAVGIELTDEQMVYQVVRKADDGLLKTEVTGKTAAEKTLQSKVVTLQGEVRHDR